MKLTSIKSKILVILIPVLIIAALAYYFTAQDDELPPMTVQEKKSRFKASVRDYYRTLGRSDAFEAFRLLKMETGDPLLLVEKLDRYSEKGAEYGHELTSIIK
jgi:uncharacterized FlgJ-related protein